MVRCASENDISDMPRHGFRRPNPPPFLDYDDMTILYKEESRRVEVGVSVDTRSSSLGSWKKIVIIDIGQNALTD